MRRLLIAVSGIASLAVPTASQATVATANLNVSITITAQCTVVNAGALAFPSSGLLTAPVNQSATFQVQCTNSTPYTVGLDTGQNASASQRRMKGGPTSSEFILYNLYSDAARSVAWGNASGSWVTGAGTGSAFTYTVYGQVPAQSTPTPAANYADVVTISVTY